jgi:hypothetical protein
VTCYAFDETRHALIATWGTGAGDVAVTVAELSPSSTTEQGVDLAHALTQLSSYAWRCYTHPARPEDSSTPNGEGRRRSEERKAFATVVSAIEKPHLPDPDGCVTECYSPIMESAHDVGRALHALDDADLTRLVISDVEHELATIEQAEQGALSGRASQAVELTRPYPSSQQVAAADEVFRAHPCGSSELFTRFDPTSAAVAATHWLYAAARVASERSETPVERVIREADGIEALNTETPTRVLEFLVMGFPPGLIVTQLVSEAMRIAEGVIPNPKGAISTIRKAERFKARYGGSDPIRITPLDPTRPARDLLGDLFDGIRGCWLLYEESAWGAPDMPDGDDDLDDHSPSIRARFENEVRALAAADHSRLLE